MPVSWESDTLCNPMKKILVIRLGRIGDVVLCASPVINLKLSFPKSKIIFLTREINEPLVNRFEGVDEIVTMPENISIIELFKTAEMLDRTGIDMVVDLHGNIRSYIISRYISAQVKVRYPKRRRERILAVKKRQLDAETPHTIDLYNKTVLNAGGKVFSKRPVLKKGVNHNEPIDFDNTLPIVAIGPGASCTTKQWMPERFAELAERLTSDNKANILVLLGEKESGLKEYFDNIPSNNIKFVIGARLDELADTISSADLLVCNDSALSHIGTAVGTPVLALFGPTHPALGFAPRGLHDEIVQADETCRPCSLHGSKPCYRDKQYCFTGITVQNVYDDVMAKLEFSVKRNPAVFIDRDGTLIKEKKFLSRPSDVEPEDGAIEAVKKLLNTGFKIIVVSNQSGVARGYFGEDTVREINERVQTIFQSKGAPLDGIYFCPFYAGGRVPEYSRESYLRKPAAGMIDVACREHDINPSVSWTIGDKRSDIKLAYVIGGRGVLVRTGYGKDEEILHNEEKIFPPELIADNIGPAVDYIVGKGSAG